ncbi:MAG: MFS transporter [Nannocystaceae bacterium]
MGRLPRALLPLYAGTIVTRMGTFVVPYLTLYLSQQRALSLTATGQVIAAGGAGLLLGNVAGGWLCDRIGRRAVVLLGLATNAVGLAALAIGLPSSAAYGLTLAVASVGAGMFPPAASAWIADLTRDEQRQRAYTVNYVCINLGMGLGPLLGGLLAAQSFRWLFIGDIATTLGCAACIAFVPTAAATRRDAISRIRWTPQTIRVLAFCAGSFLLVAPLMGMEYAVPLFVATVLGEPLVIVGIVYSINAACILVLGLPLERRLAGRDPVAMMSVAGLLWAAGLGVLVMGASTAALLVSTAVWTVGEMVVSVVVPTYVANRVGEHERGRILAVPDAMRSVAGIVAPLGLGMVWDHRGPQAVLWVLTAVPLLGALAYGLTWMRRPAR